MQIVTIRSKKELEKNLPGSKETPHCSNILQCLLQPRVIFMAKYCQDNEEINFLKKRKKKLFHQTEVSYYLLFPTTLTLF